MESWYLGVLHQRRTGRSGKSGGCLKGRLLEEKKFVRAWRQYVWSKISTVEVIVMTEQTLYQWSKECAKITLGPVWSNCTRAEKYSQSAPVLQLGKTGTMIKTENIVIWVSIFPFLCSFSWFRVLPLCFPGKLNTSIQIVFKFYKQFSADL